MSGQANFYVKWLPIEPRLSWEAKKELILGNKKGTDEQGNKVMADTGGRKNRTGLPEGRKGKKQV